ncbi:hypothetical protein [Vibrio pelagius]|uniref:hypothetical protein n=1 Tax=Vibrio pelagius TaxID=28169 RepID=UPI0021C34046|nr:hypothetical protein [Vibrio pelagius]
MRLKILSLTLISTCTIASEIEELSNISTEQSETILVTSKFHGYKLDDNSKFRYVNSVDLDGLDWAFWYGENRSHSKPNSNLISDVKTFGEFKFHHQKPASGNEYFWSNGSYRDFLDQSNHAISVKPGGGFEFIVKPGKTGKFKLDLYTHNWLAMSEFTACLKNDCVTITNYYPSHISTTKNSVEFSTETATDELTITYKAKNDQFSWKNDDPYHALEAINLSEVN